MGILELEVLNDSVKIVRTLLNDTKYNFVAIGYYLRKIDDDKLYRESGHDNIWNFAKDQFGLSKSSASRFMNINRRFSVDGYSDKLADNYQQFNVSQMSEMLTLTDEQIGQIDASTTIREIRDMKPKPEKKEEPVEEPMEGQMTFDDYPGVVPEKEVVATSQQDEKSIPKRPDIRGLMGYAYCPNCDGNLHYKKDLNCPWCNQSIDWDSVRMHFEEDEEEQVMIEDEDVSPYGYTKSEYPPDSLIATKGCGNKHDCFFCAKSCKIRQEERYCVEAPLGNSFSCTTMNVIENLKEDVGSQCEFVNQDAAYHRPGDGEASPCCKHCENVNCGYRCRRAMKTVGEGTEHYADDESNVMIDDSERYTEDDVKKYLRREEANLMVCRKENIRDNIRKHTVINVDAYGMLLGVMREEDEVLRDSHTANMFYAKGDYNSADFYLYHARKALNDTKEFDKVNMPDINEFALKIQEFPVLKNNDQRVDFIDSFESWPLWIDCKETDEKIYRYDLGEGIAIAVREKLRHRWIPEKYKYSETETEYAGHEFYLIGVEGKYGNSGYEFRINSNKTFYESLVNRSMLIEFIKKYQKGEVQ